jgi:hypothetical protein
MSRAIAAILLIAVLAIGGGLVATTAYQAGLSTAVTTAVADGGTVVAPLPAYGYGYGYGWHPGGFGFGFFGFLGTLLFLFLVIGLVRAVFFRGGPGRGWGPGGTGGPGGPGGWGPGRGWWETRGREGFEDWHRRAHESGSSNEPPASNTPSKPA